MDDMEIFAEQCARRLAEEHERIAAESRRNSEQAQQNSEEKMPSDALDDEPENLEDDMPLDALDDESENLEDDMPLDALDDESEITESKPAEAVAHEKTVAESDISAQKNSDECLPPPVKPEMNENECEAEEDGEADNKLPVWFRLIFSAILLVLGAAGIWILVFGEGLSRFFESLCFIEAALCLLIAVGLNAAEISDNRRKKNIMRAALWSIFIFYCLNAADKLFLHRMIECGFSMEGFAQYVRNSISFDILDGLSEIKGMDILQTILYITPYAFCVPVLMKSYRNIVLYFLYMTFSFMAVSTLQLISMSDGVNLAKYLVCLGGAAAVYIIIMLPPVQSGLRRVGLMEWVELTEDED
ncbi:MAG: hypothetical protein ACI4IJ_02260 [Acutalibacteraceae bacterium]